MFIISTPIVNCSLAERLAAEAEMWNAFVNGDGLFDWRLVVIDDKFEVPDEVDFEEFGYDSFGTPLRVSSNRLSAASGRAKAASRRRPLYARRLPRLYARHAHSSASSGDDPAAAPIASAASRKAVSL